MVGEAARDTAVSAIEALKASPAVLALVLLQVAVLGLVAWTAHSTRVAEQARFALMIKYCEAKDGASLEGLRAQDVIFRD